MTATTQERPDAPASRRWPRLLGLAAVAVLIAGGAIALVTFRPWESYLDPEGAQPFDESFALAEHVRAELAASAATDREGRDDPDPHIATTLTDGAFEGRSGRSAAGRANLVQLADGRPVLRLEDLAVDNGPALEVRLSPASADSPTWELDEGSESLGELIYNVGDSNYEIPTHVDLSVYESVLIRCERFGIVFAVAPFRRVVGP